MITLRVMVVEGTGNPGGDGGGDSERFGATDGATILEAFCHAQLAALPRGGRGVSAAMDLLVGIPAACRLGWPDMTVSAPQLFRMLEEAGLITGCPTASDIPPALRLVESVGGLVTQRSPRRWTVWFSSACDPDHTLGASIREAVTPAMLNRSPSTSPTESPRRATSIREERDQLASELDSLRVQFEALQEAHRKVQAELESAHERAAVTERELAELRDEREEVTAYASAVASLQATLQAVRREGEKAERGHKSLAREKRRLEEELGSERTKLREQEQRLATLASEKEAIRREVAERDADLAKSFRDLQQRDKKIAELSEQSQRRLSHLADYRQASQELDTERKRSAEMRVILRRIGRELGFGDFDAADVQGFVTSAESQIREIRRENGVLEREFAELVDSIALRLATAQYRETMYSKGWQSDQIDKMLEEPSEQRLVRKLARQSAHNARESLASRTGIEFPPRPHFWET